MKLALLILYFGVMVGIGLYCRKHTSGINGFVLGGRSVGPWLTAFAYGTSYFSAVVFVGYAGQFGWKYGIAATWAGIGNAILGSLLAWAVLGRRTRILTQHYNSATMPQFFGQRFQSKSLKIGASVIVFVFLIPYTASLFNGLSRLFGMAFHMDYTVCIILMGVLTGIYVIAGGYMATAINDFIQGCVMLVGICVVIAAVLNTQGGFLEALHGLAAVSDPETVNGEVPGIFASFFGPDPVNLLGVVILTSLGTWGLPQMVQKFYAIKSEDSIHKGTIISTLFAVVVAGGCYFLGGFGRLFADQVDVASEGYDAIIPAMLSGLPDLLIAVVVILVLSASMSTLSSLVIASSSTLTIDLLKGNIVKKMNDFQAVFIMRCFIVVFVLISMVLAIVQYKNSFSFIAQLMGVSWGALAGSFLAPFLYGLYWKKTTKAACWASFLFGSGIMTLNLISTSTGWFAFPTLLQSSINCGAFAMLAGLVIVPVVSLFTKKPDQAMVDEAFSCYEKKAPVSQKNALSELPLSSPACQSTGGGFFKNFSPNGKYT